MSDGDRPAAWQCVHCLGRIPGVSPDVYFPYCPFCSCPQPRRCRNPDCRVQLLVPTAPFCHQCQTRQQPEQQQSEQIAHPAGSGDREVRQLAQPQPSESPPQQLSQAPPQLQPDQPSPQLQPDQPLPQPQPGQSPPQPQPGQPPPQLQPGQPPPQLQPDQPPPQLQPDQPPPQLQPGQPPPQLQPDQPTPQPPPPQQQPGQSPLQQEPGQLPPQQQQLGQLPPQQLQSGQPPPQQRPDQPPPQPQPGQPPPQLQPGQPPPQPQPGQPPPQPQPDQPPPKLQPDQPPPQPQPDQPPPKLQPGQPQTSQPPPQPQPDQPPPKLQPDQPPPQPQPGQLPPPPQTGQPSSLLQTPLQSQPCQLLSQPQPGQPHTSNTISSQQPCNGLQPEATSESSQQSDSFDMTIQNQDTEKEGKEAGNTTSSQEPCNGPQPLQPKATSEHSQQLQQGASFDGSKQTQATDEETKLPGNTTSFHESSNGSKSETTSDPSQRLQQGDSIGGEMQDQDTEDKGKEASNTTSSQEPCNGPQPLQPKATSEHSQQLQQGASFDGSKQTQATDEETKLPGNKTSSHESSDGSKPETTSEPSQHLQQGDSLCGAMQNQDTVKEGKEADDTTSSQEPCNGPQPLQSKATSEHSQQEASFGGTIPQTSSSGDESTMHQKTEKKETLSSGAQKQTNPVNTDKDVPRLPPPKTPQWQHDHSQQPELKGFQSPVEKSIQITFHVLVPLPLWDWDSSSNSCMHIRFGHKDLGNWEKNCGSMTQKELGNGWCEMSCTLQIDAAILRYPIPYKYVIYSPKMERKDDCYEYCHVYSSNPNRCLWMARVKYQQAYGGTYHQYDSVVYPKNVKATDTAVHPKDIRTTKSLYQRAKAWFRRSSSSQPQEEEDTLSPFEMAKLCLQVYLDGYKQMLCSGSFPQQADLKTIVEEICHIFHLLYCPIICHQNSSQPVRQNLDQKFIEVMKEWLESVVDALQDEETENAMKQLASALCVTHCLFKVGISNVKFDKFALSVVRMLQLKPDLERKGCPDYKYLCEILPKKYRPEVATSVALLCRESRKRKFQECSWLLALPLYHFLKGFSEPFHTPVVNPEKILFNQEKELDLDSFKNKTYSSEKGFIAENFDTFEPLFVLDPLLRHVIIYICPKKDLPALFERIHPVLSTTWLTHMVSDPATRVFSKNEVTIGHLLLN